MNAWIDIENPPQVQYLAPFVDELRRRGFAVDVTARDNSITAGLLRERGIEPRLVNGVTGTNKALKIGGVAARSAQLALHVARRRSRLAVATSRPAGLTAWMLRIPCFTFCDYEYVDMRIGRLAGVTVFHPDVIPTDTLVRRGLRREQLIPFAGLKESISFAGLDVEAVPPHVFPTLEGSDVVRVLFRPPGERTHYYVAESGELAIQLLRHLASRPDVCVVFSPRYPSQTRYLDEVEWAREPILLEEGVPFVSLLRAVDAVVSSGGTMTREAAYLGIPAFSIFRSQIGEVDRYLESIGRLTIVRSVSDFADVRLERGATKGALPSDPDLVSRLVATMLERSEALKDADAPPSTRFARS